MIELCLYSTCQRSLAWPDHFFSGTALIDYKRLLRKRVWYTSNSRVVFTLRLTLKRCWILCIILMSPALIFISKMESCALCLEPFQTASSWIWNSEPRSHFCHMAWLVCRILCEIEWRKSLLMRNFGSRAHWLTVRQKMLTNPHWRFKCWDETF